MCSQKRNCKASVPISTFMCLWAIYIFQASVHIFPFSRIGRPIMGNLYKSLTDTWMWKLGLRLHNFFSGNICFEFSVLCLCSAWSVVLHKTCVKCRCWSLSARWRRTRRRSGTATSLVTIPKQILPSWWLAIRLSSPRMRAQTSSKDQVLMVLLYLIVIVFYSAVSLICLWCNVFSTTLLCWVVENICQ